MKIKSSPFLLGVILAVLTLATSACGGKSAPATAPAPAAPTTGPTTAAVQPTVAPKSVPAATTASGGASSSNLAIAPAVAKTAKAMVFSSSESFSGSAPLVTGKTDQPTDKDVTLFSEDAEFKGQDYHVRLRGVIGDLFGDSAGQGVEFTQVNGKTYVHGPALLLDAPENKWYELDSKSAAAFSFSPLTTLSQLAANADWSRFRKTSSSDSYQGQKCDFYGAEGDPASATYAALIKDSPASQFKPVIESGIVEVVVCADGYIHDYSVHIYAHDAASPDKKLKAQFNVHLSEFDGNVVVNEPSDVVALKSNANSAPTSVPTAQATPDSGQTARVGYEGEWEGQTSTDSPISFRVEKNQITFVNLGYAVQSGNCALSGSLGKTVDGVSIDGKTFTIQLSDEDNQYAFTGTFASNSEASGSLQVKGNSKSCGAFDAKSTWTAKPASNDTTSAEPTAEPEPTDAADTTDAMDVVMGFFDQLSAQDMDAALALVNDNVVFHIGSKSGVGKTGLQAAFQSQVDSGATFDLSDLDQVGGVVKFTLSVDGTDSAAGANSAIVQDGKIMTLTLQ